MRVGNPKGHINFSLSHNPVTFPLNVTGLKNQLLENNSFFPTYIGAKIANDILPQNAVINADNGSTWNIYNYDSF